MTSTTAERSARRSPRTVATREAIMITAERLFAERGVYNVSNRQLAEAAGQANNTAVAYHFGDKTNLIRAMIHRHALDIDPRREALLAQIVGADDAGEARDWIRCLVLPSTMHFASLGTPSWFARFNAQVMADPTLRAALYEDALSSPSLQRTLQGLRDTLSDIPYGIRRTRADMARQLLVHMCAECEGALAAEAAGGYTDTPVGQGPHWSNGGPTGTATDAVTGPAGSWEDLGTDLVDALTGLWTARPNR